MILAKEFLIMSLNTLNVAVVCPLLGFETTYTVHSFIHLFSVDLLQDCGRDGLKEPGAMGSGSDITTLSM
jgi:hypothetical protein